MGRRKRTYTQGNQKTLVPPCTVYKISRVGFWLAPVYLRFSCDECGRLFSLGNPYVQAYLRLGSDEYHYFHARCYFNGGPKRRAKGLELVHVEVDTQPFLKALAEFRKQCLDEYRIFWWRRIVERGIRRHAPLGYEDAFLEMLPKVSEFVKI